MKHCKDCGHLLKRLKSDSYSRKYCCSNCGLRVFIVIGNVSHGIEDNYYFQKFPFEDEIKYEPKK